MRRTPDPTDRSHAAESTDENREQAESAAANRDALAAQARRTRASTPGAADTPVGPSMSGSARDPENAAAMRAVEANRDALEEQNRRVEASAPDSVETAGPDRNDRG